MVFDHSGLRDVEPASGGGHAGTRRRWVRPTPRSVGGTDAAWLPLASTRVGRAAQSAPWRCLEDALGAPLPTNMSEWAVHLANVSSIYVLIVREPNVSCNVTGNHRWIRRYRRVFASECICGLMTGNTILMGIELAT